MSSCWTDGAGGDRDNQQRAGPRQHPQGHCRRLLLPHCSPAKNGSYRTVKNPQSVDIHPSSGLAKAEVCGLPCLLLTFEWKGRQSFFCSQHLFCKVLCLACTPTFETLVSWGTLRGCRGPCNALLFITGAAALGGVSRAGADEQGVHADGVGNQAAWLVEIAPHYYSKRS